MTFQDDELSYALGKQVGSGQPSFVSGCVLAICKGGTRKKIERSSGAIVQYVGQAGSCGLSPLAALWVAGFCRHN